MAGETVLQTERLILRNWRPDDLDPFATMSADPEVMRYFPVRHNPAETEAHIRLITDHLEHQQFGWWAVEAPGVFAFAGFTGLGRPGFHAHFTPCVEVGWRLRRDAWAGATRPKQVGPASILPSTISASTKSCLWPWPATGVQRG